jgi:hypothetical protein
MTRFGLFIGCILIFCSTGISIAATPTPVKGTAPASRAVAASNPIKRQIHSRIRTQMKDIRVAVKSGKLTPDQAKTLKLALVSTRKQELLFLKQDGANDLTSDQQSQLNQMLNKNSSSIGETTVSTAP